MSKQAAAVAWLAFRAELDEATQVINDRFDEMLAEGVLPGAEKHRPGGYEHDQSRHGRRGGKPGRQEAIETGIMSVGSTVYRLHRSYGNINGAKRYIERTVKDNPDLELEYFRHEGKYYVGEVTAVRPPPKNPPTPKPEPKRVSGQVGGLDPTYSRSGLPEPDFIHHDVAREMADSEMSKIRPNDVLLEGVAGNMYGDGTPLQRKQTSQVLAQLPLEHQAHVFDVTVANSSGLGEYGGSSERTVGFAEAKSITIAGRRGYIARSKTIVHEVGHSLLGRGTRWSLPGSDDFEERRRKTRTELGEVIRRRHRVADVRPVGTGKYLSDKQARKVKAVTHYAKGNVGEYMAESYAHYVVKPSLLKSRDPEAYAILRDELFQGQEYPDLSAR